MSSIQERMGTKQDLVEMLLHERLADPDNTMNSRNHTFLCSRLNGSLMFTRKMFTRLDELDNEVK